MFYLTGVYLYVCSQPMSNTTNAEPPNDTVNDRPKLAEILEGLEYAVKFFKQCRVRSLEFKAGVQFTETTLEKLKAYAEPRKAPTKQES